MTVIGELPGRGDGLEEVTPANWRIRTSVSAIEAQPSTAIEAQPSTELVTSTPVVPVAGASILESRPVVLGAAFSGKVGP